MLLLRRLLLSLGLLLLAILLSRFPDSSASPAATRWFKGNTHTHTTESDGDSPPDVVATWYAEHGYDFLVLSDHNKLTDPAVVRPKVRVPAGREFLLIPGEEITQGAVEPRPSAAPKGVPIHVNGINLKKVIPTSKAKTRRETAEENFAAVRAQGGVAHLNHPNFGWAMDMAAMKSLLTLKIFEIYNGHPKVHNEGDATHPSTEAYWDALLSAGRRVWGIADDDAHHYKKWGPEFSNPGRGWVRVRAAELTPDAITGAIDRGDFYGSSGVELEDLETGSGKIRLTVRTEPGKTYRIEFVGREGKVLKETAEPAAECAVSGAGAYVRARITDSTGAKAWTQPAFAD